MLTSSTRTSQVRLAYHIVAVFAALLLVNFIVAGILGQIESLNYTNAFYLTMSATTLSGYGNVATETVAGKWFISFYQIFGYGLYFYLLSVVCLARLDKDFALE